MDNITFDIGYEDVMDAKERDEKTAKQLLKEHQAGIKYALQCALNDILADL